MKLHFPGNGNGKKELDGGPSGVGLLFRYIQGLQGFIEGREGKEKKRC